MTTPSAPNAPQDSSRNIDAIGDEHVGTSIDTPLRPDAFDMSDDDKVKAIEQKFREIMDIMGLDLTDDSLSGTPQRVAKMYVKEIFAGLNPANHPDVKTFDNVYGYDHMLVERNITLNSTCEHHFLPHRWGRSRGVHPRRSSGWVEQAESHCGPLCQASPGSRAPCQDKF